MVHGRKFLTQKQIGNILANNVEYKDLDDAGKTLFHIGRYRRFEDNKSFEFLLKVVDKDISVFKMKWHIKGLDEDDIYQECCLQVVRAIQLFDPSRNNDFRSYCRILFTGKLNSLMNDVERLKNRPINFSHSLQAPVSTDLEGNSVCFEDIIPNSDSSFLDDLCYEEYISSLEDKLYSNLSDLEAKAFALYLHKYPYKEIADILRKNRKSIGNAIQRVKTKIPVIFSEDIRQKELEQKRFRNNKKTKLSSEESSKRKDKK